MLAGRRLRLRTREGQALVEISFIPIIKTKVLLGIIEVVRIYRAKSYLIDASRAGVRLAGLAYDDLSIANTSWSVLHDHGMDSAVDNGPSSNPRYTCNLRRLEIYKATQTGALDPSEPNNEDVLYTTPYTDPTTGSVWCEFLIQTLALKYPNNYQSHDTEVPVQ